jgi:hypothetical protein
MNKNNYTVAINDEQEDHFYNYAVFIKTDSGPIVGHLIECETTNKHDPSSTEFTIKKISKFGEYQSFNEIPNSWTQLGPDWYDYILPLVAVNKILELTSFEDDTPCPNGGNT